MLEIYYLMEMPEFRAEVERVFQEKLSGKASEFVGFLAKRRDLIRDEAILDAAKWELGDFENEAAYLLDWVEKRYGMFEIEYGEAGRVNL